MGSKSNAILFVATGMAMFPFSGKFLIFEGAKGEQM